MMDVAGSFASGANAGDAQFFALAGDVRTRFANGRKSRGTRGGKCGVIEKSTTSKGGVLRQGILFRHGSFLALQGAGHKKILGGQDGA